MAQWGITDVASNSVNYGTEEVPSGPYGSGNAAKAANNTALYQNTTVGAFTPLMAVGQFGVSAAEKANTTSSESAYVTHPGWTMRRAGTGPVVSLSGSAGTGFANGETVTVSGGTTNATGVITANATGNIATIAVSGEGGTGFPNTSALSYTFNREKHLNSITVSGTPTGYSNTDTIQVGNGTINATASISTNSSGGFVTANVTITANHTGLWPNATTNSQITFTVVAANGSASAGSGATFAGTLANSSGGSATAVLGGRAGRISYETLVAMGSMTDGTADDTYLPQ